MEAGRELRRHILFFLTYLMHFVIQLNIRLKCKKERGFALCANSSGRYFQFPLLIEQEEMRAVIL